MFGCQNRNIQWEEQPEVERIPPLDEDKGDVDVHLLEGIVADYACGGRRRRR